MSRRTLSIIALLLVVSTGAFAWKNLPSQSVAQFGGPTQCGNGICEGGEGYILCPEDCPTECGNGYCDNYEVQQGGQYYCPADCEVCPNGGTWPECQTCPDGQYGDWPSCSCENGGDPGNNCETDPCSDPDAYENNPDCNDCLKGSCSDEDKCSGACTGRNERCEGVQLSNEQRGDLCDCRNVQDADDFCKTNGIGFQYPNNAPGDQGKYCDGGCRVTECSDGEPNKEKSVGNEYISPGTEFDDGLADKNDIGCYPCEDCAAAGHLGIEDFDATRSEYDTCHDPAFPPKQQSEPVELTFAYPSFWDTFMAALLQPNAPRGKVYQCAIAGQMAYDQVVNLQTKDVTNTLITNGAKVSEQACTHCMSKPEVETFTQEAEVNNVKGMYTCSQILNYNIGQDSATINNKLTVDLFMAKQIPGWDNLTKKQQSDFEKALKQKADYDIRGPEAIKKQRDFADSFCSSECNDLDNWPDLKEKGLGVPAPLVAQCMLTCSCSCYPTGAVADITDAIKQKRDTRDEDVPLPADDFGAQCFTRCYYDVKWNGNARGETACYEDCKSMYCPIQTKFPKNPTVKTPQPTGTSGGGSGRGGGGDTCYGQFWNGCQYDLCTIMSWYGQDCGFNPPSLPNIAGGAGGGGGGGISGTTGGGTSTPATTGTNTGGGPGGGGPGGGPGGTSGGGTNSTSSRLSSSGFSSRASSVLAFSSSRTSTLSQGSSRSSAFSYATSRSSIPFFERASSSRSSARSNSSFWFGTASSYLQVLACPPDACGVNGNAGNTFCAQQGMTCMQSNTIPCIRCIEGEFGSSSFGGIPFSASSVSSGASRPSVLCGNGRTDSGEECDDGNQSNADSCTTACRIRVFGSSAVSSAPLVAVIEPSRPGFDPRFCGNGSLNPGEDCDLGSLNSDLPNASCRTDCSLSRCGDRIVDGVLGEQCDDGNAANGDGCSASCSIEQFAGQPNQVLPGSLVELPFVPATPNQASVLPTVPAHGPVGDTGPEAIAIMAAGASAGYTWMRMKRKRF